jgi:hypothetical protein
MKFCLLTLGLGEGAARFAFFLTDPAQLAEPERNFTLTPDQIARLNPNTRTAPVFHSRADAELTLKIHDHIPVLIDEGNGTAGNSWSLDFHSRIWHMAEDSQWFRTAAQLATTAFMREGSDFVAMGVAPRQSALAVEGAGAGSLDLSDGGPRRSIRYLPLYEAKMIHQFDHRWATYEADGETSRDVTLDEKKRVDFEPHPRYWVPETEVAERLSIRNWDRQWLTGWRDIARTTDERTVIVTVTPRLAVGNTMPLVFPNVPPRKWAGALGNLNSLILDYVARQSVGGTHLTFGYLRQFPVLPPLFYSELRLDFVVPRVLELSFTSYSLAPFARDLGYQGPPFAWNEDRRAELWAELNAFYARAYGLTKDELRYILDPADVKGPDYPSETFRVLKEKEMRQYNEFRTQRLVLAAWNRMESDGTFNAMGL